MKNSSDTIGNRTRDLPACRAVSQPTAPPRTSKVLGGTLNKYSLSYLIFIRNFVFFFSKRVPKIV